MKETKGTNTMFRVTNVTSREDNVTIEMNDPAMPVELQEKLIVDVVVNDNGKVNILITDINQQVKLLSNGEVERYPYVQDELNDLENAIENTLRLFKEIAHRVKQLTRTR